MDSQLLSLVLDPLSYGFMQRGLLMAVLIALVCSIFSCFLVLKGWALLGDAISHAILPGLAVAAMVGAPLSLGAFAAGLLCAAGIGKIKHNSRLKEDAVMGIVFSGMFAFGLVLVTKIETEVHLMHVLFGNVLGVSPADLWEAGTIAALCSALMLLKRKDFMLHCFDPVQAAVLGLPVKVLELTMLALLALTVVAALKAVGIILVVAMLIAPGATGFVTARSFDHMLLIAITSASLACIGGTLISFHTDTATGPLIVLLQAGFFVVAAMVGKKRQGSVS